jgi:hypothetical protein
MAGSFVSPVMVVFLFSRFTGVFYCVVFLNDSVGAAHQQSSAKSKFKL